MFFVNTTFNLNDKGVSVWLIARERNIGSKEMLICVFYWFQFGLMMEYDPGNSLNEENISFLECFTLLDWGHVGI